MDDTTTVRAGRDNHNGTITVLKLGSDLCGIEVYKMTISVPTYLSRFLLR